MRNCTSRSIPTVSRHKPIKHDSMVVSLSVCQRLYHESRVNSLLSCPLRCYRACKLARLPISRLPSQDPRKDQGIGKSSERVSVELQSSHFTPGDAEYSSPRSSKLDKSNGESSMNISWKRFSRRSRFATVECQARLLIRSPLRKTGFVSIFAVIHA